MTIVSNQMLLQSSAVPPVHDSRLTIFEKSVVPRRILSMTNIHIHDVVAALDHVRGYFMIPTCKLAVAAPCAVPD